MAVHVCRVRHVLTVVSNAMLSNEPAPKVRFRPEADIQWGQMPSMTKIAIYVFLLAGVATLGISWPLLGAKSLAFKIGLTSILLAIQVLLSGLQASGTYGVYGELSLYFKWRDTYWASQYREKIVSLGSVAVIELRYYHLFLGWHISIHAVPREHAQNARNLLSSKVLPALALVLEKIKPESTDFSWSAHYDLSSGDVRYGA